MSKLAIKRNTTQRREDTSVIDLVTSFPAEIQYMILESRGISPVCKLMNQEREMHERITIAGTKRITSREAEKLYESKGFALFRYAHSLDAYLFSGPTKCDVLLTDVDTETDDVSYTHGKTNMSDEEETKESAVYNIMSRSCLEARRVRWEEIPNNVKSVGSGLVSFISIDIRNIFSILLDRFDIVDPDNKTELAKEWTLRVFRAVVNEMRKRRASSSLLLYLVINAVYLAGVNGGDYIHGETREQTEDYVEWMKASCIELEALIVNNITAI